MWLQEINMAYWQQGMNMDIGNECVIGNECGYKE